MLTTRAALLLTAIGALIGGSTLWLKPAVRVVYNASDSAPRGFYRVTPATSLKVGEYVVAVLPEQTAKLAAARGYLPRSVPVLKQIAALGGQQVCISGDAVYVARSAVARLLPADGLNRPLSAWKHCRQLVQGEAFLLNTGNADSFDSRYFGPLDLSFIRGRAVPLWTFGVK